MIVHMHGYHEDGFYFLGFKDIPLCLCFRRHLRNNGHMNILQSLQLLHPPREDTERQILQHFNLGLDSGCTPFMSVVHRLAWMIQQENITAVNILKHPDLFESLIDFIINPGCRQINEKR